MKTSVEKQKLIELDEEIAITRPPVKVTFPIATSQKQQKEERPLDVLPRLAQGISQIHVTEPAPPKPKPRPKPRVHQRPNRGFD
jgi:hypothetical protein